MGLAFFALADSTGALLAERRDSSTITVWATPGDPPSSILYLHTQTSDSRAKLTRTKSAVT
jgi:hypothetical protein